MSTNYIKLYTASDSPDSAFFLNSGSIYFYATNEDKYAIKGNNLIVGTTELIMKHFLDTETERLETAVAEPDSVLKKLSHQNFLEGMETFIFVLNVSMVLAKQITLTNQIINKNLNNLVGDEKKTREYSINYYQIVKSIQEEHEKRKLPWLNLFLQKAETNLTYKRGEAYYKSAEPTKIITTINLTAKDTEYSRDSIICEENTVGNEMYILASGHIDVEINGNNVATISEQGTVIGEMALLLGEKRSATLKAKNSVIITKIKKEDLKEIASKDFSIVQTIAKSLAKRHFYNLMKIESINNSILEQFLKEEKGEKKISHSHKANLDLETLKTNVNSMAREKDAGFLFKILQ